MAELHLDVISTSSSKGLTDAQRDLRETRAEADKLGKSFGDLEHESFDLEHAIASSRQEVVRLTNEFKKTGDRTLLFDMRREKSFLHDLEEVAGQGGRAAGSAFSSGFGLSMHQLRGPLIAVLVGTVVAALPTIGALVGGAVAGAIGTVGIAGGVVMAAKDARVRSAFSDFTDAISREFFRGEAFVSPIINSLAILRDAFKDMKVPEAFAVMAPLVTTIAGGLAEFGRNIMPGVNTAFSRMEPFAQAAAKGFADMGRAFSSFLTDVTASKGTVQGLAALFNLVNNTIIGLGNGIRWLSDRMVKFNEGVHKTVDILLAWPAALGGPVGDFRTALEMLDKGLDNVESHDGSGIKETGSAINGLIYPTKAAALALGMLGEHLVDVKNAMQEVQDAISESINVQMSQDRANLEVEQGWVDLTEALNRNGSALRDGTQAARNNETALLSQIGALAQQREANIRAGMAASDANAIFDAAIGKLIGIGVNAGISKEALDRLAGNYQVNVRFQSNFSQWLADFGYLLPGFGGGPWGAVTSFAAGGTTPAWEPFKVHKDEMLFSDQPHYVATKAQVDAMDRGGGWGGGDRTITVIVKDTSGRTLKQELITDALGRGIPQSVVRAAYP